MFDLYLSSVRQLNLKGDLSWRIRHFQKRKLEAKGNLTKLEDGILIPNTRNILNIFARRVALIPIRIIKPLSPKSFLNGARKRGCNMCKKISGEIDGERLFKLNQIMSICACYASECREYIEKTENFYDYYHNRTSECIGYIRGAAMASDIHSLKDLADNLWELRILKFKAMSERKG